MEKDGERLPGPEMNPENPDFPGKTEIGFTLEETEGMNGWGFNPLKGEAGKLLLESHGLETKGLNDSFFYWDCPPGPGYAGDRVLIGKCQEENLHMFLVGKGNTKKISKKLKGVKKRLSADLFIDCFIRWSLAC